MHSTAILNIGTANPPNGFSQEQILSFMEHISKPDKLVKRKMNMLYKTGGIKKRHSVLKDYGLTSDQFEFYSKNADKELGPQTKERMTIFKRHALDLCLEAIKDAAICKKELSEVTHVISVSCTGLMAPGLDIELVEKLGLKRIKGRFGLNFMGCYAAINALKMGQSICQSDQTAKVLIITVELCTLHFQNEIDDDNLLANSLFADGAATVLLASDKQVHYKKKGDSYWVLKEGFSALIPQGKNDMAWEIGNYGFQMKLSSYIPKLIKANLKKIINERTPNHFESEKYQWAVHPGGKKILDEIKGCFQLEDHQIASSYETLKNFGNMSSATILFVLKDIFSKKEYDQKNILMIAFGPGLTIENIFLEKI